MGSLWLSGARLFTNVLSFISIIVLARILMPADFGIVALASTLMVILSSITSMPLSEALIQQSNPTREHFNTAWTLSALRGLGLAAALAAASWPMAIIYDDERLIPMICVMAMGLVIGGLSNPRRIMFQRDLVFWQEFLLIVAERVTMVGSTIWLALEWGNYWALVVGTLIGQMVQVIVSYMILPYLPRLGFRHAKELWGFSVWLGLGSAVNTINWRFDQLLVGGLLGNSTLGHYTVGSNLAQVPTRETTAPLRQTLFPALARITDEPHRLSHAYQRAQALLTFAALPIGIVVAVIADLIVEATMGEKWLPSVPVIQALSAVFALQTLGSMVTPLGMAKGETKLLFRRDLLMFFIRLPIIIAGTFAFGLVGLIGARVISGLIDICVSLAVIRHLTKLSIKEQIWANWRSLTSSAIMLVFAFIAQQVFGFGVGFSGSIDAFLQIIGAISVCFMIYMTSNILLWWISGRPNGPETDVFRFFGQVLLRIRSRKLAS